jgi:catechol 2,3-dioxygenase-like lactoylglutathione lyase family enzyme
MHHADLAVTDVERSLAFYLNLLGPPGWAEMREALGAERSLVQIQSPRLSKQAFALSEAGLRVASHAG